MVVSEVRGEGNLGECRMRIINIGVFSLDEQVNCTSVN
jgi:hypothetical protein